MATIARIISFPVAFAFALAGCGGPSPYVGNWRGEREIQFEEGTDPALAGTARRVTLRVTRDGTFNLVDGGMPMEGRLDGNRLVVEYVADRPVPRDFPQAFGLITEQDQVKLLTPSGIIDMQRSESATPGKTSP